MKRISIFILLLIIQPLHADEPKYPDWVVSYLGASNSPYTVPQGEMQERVKQFLGVNKPAWFIETDLTGDTHTDFGGLLRAPSGDLALITLVQASGGVKLNVLVEAVTVDSSEVEFFVDKEPPGIVYDLPQEGDLNRGRMHVISYSGLHLFRYGAESVLYYWNGKKFESVTTGD